MPYISPEILAKAKQIDLLTYLKNYDPNEVIKISDNNYTTRTHDSLKISNGKWMWWSRGIGGKNAIDYLVKVKGMSFLDAAETITEQISIKAPIHEKKEPSFENKQLLLPKRYKSTDKVFNYLLERGIDYEILNYCIGNKLIFESLPYHNAVFIGYDENHNAKYASYRSIKSNRIMGDCTGSKKQYSFRLENKNCDEVHLFECPIDLLSYATLCKLAGKDWRSLNLLSLAGVYSPKKNTVESKVPSALNGFLNRNPKVKRIILHLDNDKAGRNATKTLKIIMSNKYEVIDNSPLYGKDFNDFLKFTLSKTKNERNFKQ